MLLTVDSPSASAFRLSEGSTESRPMLHSIAESVTRARNMMGRSRDGGSFRRLGCNKSHLCNREKQFPSVSKHEAHPSAKESLAKIPDESYMKQQHHIVVQYSVDPFLPCFLLSFLFEFLSQVLLCNLQHSPVQ